MANAGRFLSLALLTLTLPLSASATPVPTSSAESWLIPELGALQSSALFEPHHIHLLEVSAHGTSVASLPCSLFEPLPAPESRPLMSNEALWMLSGLPLLVVSLD